MLTLLRTVVVAALAVGGSAVSAHADSIIPCPLNQATRTITNLPPGWTAGKQTSPVTDYKVDNSGGQQRLICVYGAAGQVARVAPAGETCSKINNRRFKCVGLPPPPPPGPSVVSNGQIQLADNTSADLDGGGAQDIRLDASNPFVRLFVPLNGTRFAAQGTHKPTPAECLSAPYSNNAIPQQQLPVGVWLCVRTSNNNVGRIFVANIAGIPGLPLPMTMFLDHTTWSAGPGPGPGPDPDPGPGPSGDVYSAKTLAVKQTFAFDLDEGAIGSGPGADVWFQAVNPVQLFLQPTNGAQFAVGDRSNRGYEGCSNESFSPAKVALNTLPAGSYVCAVTSEGRVSQFRLTAISPGSPKTLTIKTTTWE